MARKQEKEWVIDEWDDSLDNGQKPKPDPFGIPESGTVPDESWDDTPSATHKEKDVQKSSPSHQDHNKKKTTIRIAAVISICIIIVVFLAGRTGIKPPDSTAAPPRNPATKTVTAVTEPISVVAESHAPQPTANPTTDPIAELTLESAVLQNAWYNPEYRYYYQYLTSHEKEMFDIIYTGAVNHKNGVVVDFLDNNELNRVIYVLQHDCPELFCLSLEFSTALTRVYLKYRMDDAQYIDACDKINAIFDDIASSFSAGSDDFEKELVIYRYLIDHCEYLIASDDTTEFADSCLLTGTSQCSGYANALSLALRHFGIKCNVAFSSEHAWNMVSINDQWYNCDVTWDDPGDALNDIPSDSQQDNYFAWMNIPDRLFCEDPDHKAEIEPGFPLPEAISMEDSYVMRKGTYFPTGIRDIAASITNTLMQADLNSKTHVLIMLDDQKYIDQWDTIYSDLLNKYRSIYGWSIYPPEKSHRCIYLVKGGS